MKFRLLAIVVFLLICAFPALGAASYPCADNETNCDPYAPDEDTGGGYLGTGAGSEWNGGNYATCLAKSSRGQHCWFSGLDEETHQPRCYSAAESGACGCHKTTKQTTGFCDYVIN